MSIVSFTLYIFSAGSVLTYGVSISSFVKLMRKEGRDIEGGGCMKDKDGRLVVSEKDFGKSLKESMEKIMNEENQWVQMVQANMVEGPVEGVTDKKVMEAINKMKMGKAAGPSEVNMDMIIASGKLGVGVMKKLCQRILDAKGMAEEWKTSVVVPIFKGKRDVMDYGEYRRVKLLKHAMKIVKTVLENQNKTIGTDR